MATLISDFVTIHVYKTGKILYKTTPTNEANICRWLRDHGYAKTQVEGRERFIQRTERGIRLCGLHDLKIAFKDYLSSENFDDLLKGIGNKELVEWFYRTNPIKRNGIFYEYLSGSST